MRFFVAGVAVLLSFTNPPLRAQRSLSPEDAVAMALSQNVSLSASEARITAAQGLRLQAGLKPNPRLILQNENARVPVSSPLRFSTDTDSFAYLSQVFEAGGKRERRVDAAAENLRGSELNRDAQRSQIAFRVLNAYWEAVGFQQLATVLADSLRILDQTVQYHRDRVREGALPEADLIRVQLEHQQVAVSLRNAEQDTRRSLLLLFREIGIPEEKDLTLTGTLAGASPSILTVEDEAIERRADVKLAVQSLRQAQAAVRLQHANAKPDPEVIFGYKRTVGLNTLVAGVQINLPVRNRNEGAIAAAAGEETAASLSLRALRTAARTEIQTLRGEYEQKKELFEQLMPAMRAQAAETRRIADAVYREGASDLLRLLDAERVRIQTETLYIRSGIDFRLAEINLRAALGLLP